MFCDAHFHLIPSIKKLFPEAADSAVAAYFAGFSGCTCAHSQEEYSEQKKTLGLLNESRYSLSGSGRRNSSDGCRIYNSFGLHPQMPLLENVDFLEALLQNKELDAIGECGFDLFTPEFKANLENQKKAWHIQIELAQKYNMPVIIHSRKSMELLFASARELKKLPAVLFHSFPDNPPAAFSLLRHGINGFFSFGKQILNGNKKAIACVRELPLENLLLETDAPFQTLKNEVFTAPKEIERVYHAAFCLRSQNLLDSASHAEAENPAGFDNFCQKLQDNFYNLFASSSSTL